MGNIIDISDRFNIQNKKLEIFNNVANAYSIVMSGR